jgi:hypothetical protein
MSTRGEKVRRKIREIEKWEGREGERKTKIYKK